MYVILSVCVTAEASRQVTEFKQHGTNMLTDIVTPCIAKKNAAVQHGRKTRFNEKLHNCD